MYKFHEERNQNTTNSRKKNGHAIISCEQNKFHKKKSIYNQCTSRIENLKICGINWIGVVEFQGRIAKLRIDTTGAKFGVGIMGA